MTGIQPPTDPRPSRPAGDEYDRAFEHVFVLCTGRCGSTTFIRAAQHATNYSAAHESRSSLLGDERLRYPRGHIEADNRLSWILGRMEAAFGREPLYIHLRRDAEATANSFMRRFGTGIIGAYDAGILMGGGRGSKLDICRDYVETVNSNIEAFLVDKPHRITINLESLESDFETFWFKAGVAGSLEAALDELEFAHNSSPGIARRSLRRFHRRARTAIEPGDSQRRQR